MSETVTLPVEQFQQINTKLATLEAAAAQAETARRAEEARRLIAAGESDAVLKLHRDQLAMADERGRKLAVASEIARALSGHRLAGEAAAAQLTQLLSRELVADATPDGYAVRTPTYQSASDFIKTTLARPDYAHFLAAQPTAPGSRPASPGNPAQPGTSAAPQTLGQAMVMEAQSRREARAAEAKSDQRMDMSQPFGLRGTAAGTPAPGPMGLGQFFSR